MKHIFDWHDQHTHELNVSHIIIWTISQTHSISYFGKLFPQTHLLKTVNNKP